MGVPVETADPGPDTVHVASKSDQWFADDAMLTVAGGVFSRLTGSQGVGNGFLDGGEEPPPAEDGAQGHHPFRGGPDPDDAGRVVVAERLSEQPLVCHLPDLVSYLVVRADSRTGPAPDAR